ncbi:hypothetical protein C8Q76DRAFT_737959 [Earliella scabrosa]|nr:hypothetical protein C8Q76DRAFT_737959 [Earliella scabrosa]
MDRSTAATNSFPYQPFPSHTYPIMTSTSVVPHPVYAQQHVMTVGNPVTRSRPSEVLTALSTEVSSREPERMLRRTRAAPYRRPSPSTSTTHNFSQTSHVGSNGLMPTSSAHDPFNRAIHPLSSALHIIPQERYLRGVRRRKTPYLVHFDEGGVNVADALVHELSAYNEDAFPPNERPGDKIIVRFLFKPEMTGWLSSWSHQYTIKSACCSTLSIGRLASVVARAVNDYLKNARGYKYPCCWNGTPVKLEQLYMMGIERVSQGSVQAVLGVSSASHTHAMMHATIPA